MTMSTCNQYKKYKFFTFSFWLSLWNLLCILHLHQVLTGTRPFSKSQRPYVATKLDTAAPKGVGDNYRDNVRKGFSEEVEFKLRSECSAQSQGKSAPGGGMASAKALRQGWVRCVGGSRRARVAGGEWAWGQRGRRWCLRGRRRSCLVL